MSAAQLHSALKGLLDAVQVWRVSSGMVSTAEAWATVIEAEHQARTALAASNQMVDWTAMLALINEYAMHVNDASNHQAASRADISQASALKALAKMREMLTVLGLIAPFDLTAPRVDSVTNSSGEVPR